MANGTADDTALHIAAPFVAGHHAVTHQECGGANMVGNHAQALVAQISATRFAGSGLDQRVKNIDLVVAVHVLQDGRKAFESHTGVDAGRGQRRDRSVFVHIELHEHVVPNLNEAVAVFVGASGWAAENVVTVVVKDFRTRATRAGISHHPKVV